MMYIVFMSDNGAIKFIAKLILAPWHASRSHLHQLEGSVPPSGAVCTACRSAHWQQGRGTTTAGPLAAQSLRVKRNAVTAQGMKSYFLGKSIHTPFVGHLWANQATCIHFKLRP
jgi:hypothetical protein